MRLITDTYTPEELVARKIEEHGLTGKVFFSDGTLYTNDEKLKMMLLLSGVWDDIMSMGYNTGDIYYDTKTYRTYAYENGRWVRVNFSYAKEKINFSRLHSKI